MARPPWHILNDTEQPSIQVLSAQLQIPALLVQIEQPKVALLLGNNRRPGWWSLNTHQSMKQYLEPLFFPAIDKPAKGCHCSAAHPIRCLSTGLAVQSTALPARQVPAVISADNTALLSTTSLVLLFPLCTPHSPYAPTPAAEANSSIHPRETLPRLPPASLLI